MKYEDPGNVYWRNFYIQFNNRIDQTIKDKL